MLPFRKQAGDGDPPEWEPPSYAVALDDNSDEEWKPPNYAKPIEEDKVQKPGVMSRVVNALKPRGSNVKPLPEPELGNPSSEERIKAANELKDPGPGIYFKDHPDKVEKEQPNKKPSVFNRALSAITEAPKFITNPIDKFANEVLDPPRLHPTNPEDPGFDQFRAFGAGALQGASKMLSPLNIALSAIGATEASLVKKIGAGASELIPFLNNVQKARQAISIPVAAHGAYNIAAPDKTLQERIEGIPELAGGLAGTFGGKFTRVPNEEMPLGLNSREPSVRQPKGEVPYRAGGSPQAFEYPDRVLQGDIPLERQHQLKTDEHEFAGESIRQPEALQRDFGYNERDSAGPGYVQPTSQGDLDPRQLKNTKEIIPTPPPTASEPPIQQPRAFINPFEKPVKETQISAPAPIEDNRPLPTRSPNLDPNRFPIGVEESSSAPPKKNDDILYDIARKKFNMGADIPEKASEWKPPDYAGQPIEEGLTPSEENKPIIENKPQKLEPVTAKQVRDKDYEKLFNNPDEDSYSQALDRHIKSIQEEVDPAIVKDNYENWKQEFEHAKLKKDENAMETAGTLKDEAYERLKTLNRKKSSSKFADEVSGRDDEDISFAKVKGGGLVIDTDIKRATQNLTKDYTSPLSGIMNREGMQNAMDAADKLGLNGEIRVRLNGEENNNPATIEIHDNGSGLDETGLSDKLVRLFASGKSSEEGATGGKGIGSASYIAGGKHFEIRTVAVDSVDGKKYEIIASGTPDQFQDPERGSDYERNEVSQDTPTGTVIKVKLKPEQDIYHSRNMMDKIIEHTRERSSKIIYDESGVSSGNIENLQPSKYVKEHQFKSSKDDKLIGKYTLDNNEVRIQVPKFDPDIKRNEINVHFLNNGMYQFSDYISLNGESIKGVPEDVIVNIHPLVDEMHDDYPFINTREDLKKDLKKQIMEYVEKNIAKPAIDEKKNRTQEIYDSLSAMSFSAETVRNPLFFDPGNRLTPDESNLFKNNETIKDMIKIFDTTIDNMLDRIGRDKWSDRLEGVGLSLDPDSHGMHIPDPSSKKSSIVLNPFIRINHSVPKDAAFDAVITMLHEVGHIGKEAKEDFDWSETDTQDPRFIKYLTAYQKQILNHGDTGYQNTGHQMDFVHRLGEVFAKFGVEPTFDAADRLEELYTDGSKTGKYSPEIQKLLQIYKESRGREATTEDLLAATGIKQKGGKSDSGSGNNSDGEGASAATLDKLFNSLSEAKSGMEEQESIYKTERARRFAEFSRVKQGGAAGAAKSLSKLRGEFEKVNPGDRLNLEQKETDSLFTSVKKANITPGEKARGYTALFKLLNGESVPQRNELAILDSVFGSGFSDKIIEMHGGIGATGLKIAKLANTMKSMQNAMSLAAPLRHGIGLAYRKEFAPAFADMFKFYGNKEFYDASMQAIQDNPDYLIKREAGLYIAKPGSVSGAEEEFLNSYIGKVPVARNVVGASQRGYTGFLNELRDDVSSDMLKTAEGLGYKKANMIGDQAVPTKETEAIMRFVNVFTGRGRLPFGLEKMTNELNVALWSPRMMASRIEMFTNPKIYMDLPKGMRLEGLKSLLGIAALGTVIDTALSYAGAKISYNILSTDFGKSRFGTKLIDPWGGLQQYVVGAARFLAGKTDSSQPTNRLEITGRFLANKESPAFSLGHTLLTAKKFTGKSDDPLTAGNFIDQYGTKKNIGSEIGKQFVPIFIQDINNLIESDPDFTDHIGLNAIMGVGSLTGMAQDYPEKRSGMKFRKMKMKLK